MGATAPTSVEALSAWLYQARVSRGLSQEAVALRAGIAVPTYGRLERAGLSGKTNRVSLETFLRLVAALEPDAHELVELLGTLRLAS